MATALPDFIKFNISVEPSSVGVRWTTWLSEFENLIIALGTTDKKRQRALMLYYGGNELHEIYRSLIGDDADEDFEAAKEKLSSYFEPKINKTYEIFHFRKMQQSIADDKEGVNSNKSIDAFITRLRKTASRCGFTDKDTEIKYQVIFGCRSPHLRRYALQKDELTLDDLGKKGRAHEISQQQASVIEGNDPQECNKIRRRPGKYSGRYDPSQQRKNKPQEPRTKLCFNCGKEWPHAGGNMNCPARGKQCRRCNKYNHYENMCKSSKQFVKAIDDNEESSNEASSADDDYVYLVNQSNKKGLNNNIEFSDDESYIYAIKKQLDAQVKRHYVN